MSNGIRVGRKLERLEREAGISGLRARPRGTLRVRCRGWWTSVP